ncbi:fructoselysine-6-P-deglycase FrlB-like protein [Murinocardiopsis flavida]|uniref:Glutamine--fructose-6-phosphate aminotransferase [isomerizing] n=1 Tax=Murinocardiopsis flavida TaxID=645275 RepID=A0A2P8DMM2_9ACTN|nr:sugar isomerase [Murinocardiopsis flavida]PSK98458.1 fructoselysine-6-P-deglycase FrlB-like protein [Murinocardiopsis flavida]
MHTRDEIASQPDTWRAAADLAPTAATRLPASGERVAVLGCGTSWFVAQSYAWLRESAGHGLTDAFQGSAFPAGRRYDRVVAISRSGTTSEILATVAGLHAGTRVTALVAAPGTPLCAAASDVVALPFADERSVVQTRFPTSLLVLLRAHLGEDVAALPAQAERALAAPLPDEHVKAEQVTFLGADWAFGLAQEAALKMRETARAWSESYTPMEYRHGPLAIAEPGRLTWLFTGAPEGLADQVAATGAAVKPAVLDPLAELVHAQRLAVRAAEDRGIDPDVPRNLTRSVILP